MQFASAQHRGGLVILDSYSDPLSLLCQENFFWPGEGNDLVDYFGDCFVCNVFTRRKFL